MMKTTIRYQASLVLLVLLFHVSVLFSAVSGQCTFCPDGSEPPHPQLVIEELDLPCGFLARRASSLSIDDTNPGICAEYAGLATMCGCPQPDDACTLCENTRQVPNKGLSIGPNACDQLELEGSIQSSTSWSLCPSWRATYGVYCGCENPISSKGYCRICGDQMLPDPNVVVEIDDLGFEITCADIELNEDNLSCDAVQSTYSSVCCTAVSIKKNETLEVIEVATGENKTVRESNETLEEAIDDNSTDVDSSETLEGVENNTTILVDITDNATEVNSNETMDKPAEDTSLQNPTISDQSDTSEAIDDASADKTPGVVSNETLEKEDENAAVEDETTLMDSNETTENNSDLDDTGDTSVPSSDLGQPDDESSLASAAHIGGEHPSLLCKVVVGLVFMVMCRQPA